MNNKLKEWLEQEKKLLENVTPGPWKYDHGNLEIEKEDDRFGICDFGDWLHALQEYNRWNDDEDPIYPHYMHDNAEWIAHVRTSHVRAIEIIEQLINEIDKLNE